MDKSVPLPCGRSKCVAVKKYMKCSHCAPLRCRYRCANPRQLTQLRLESRHQSTPWANLIDSRNDSMKNKSVICMLSFVWNRNEYALLYLRSVRSRCCCCFCCCCYYDCQQSQFVKNRPHPTPQNPPVPASLQCLFNKTGKISSMFSFVCIAASKQISFALATPTTTMKI